MSAAIVDLDRLEKAGLLVHVDRQESLGILVGEVEYSGTIVDVDTGRVVSACPARVENYPPLMADLLFTVPMTEGVMVRVFFHEGQWRKATHRKINAYSAFWTSNKSIGTLFDEVARIDYDTLDQQCTYSYHLRHPEHRILVQVSEPSVELISIRNNATLIETAVHTDLPAQHPLEQQNKMHVYKTPDGRIVRVREQTLHYQKLLKARNVSRDLAFAAAQFDQETARLWRMYFPADADLPSTSRQRMKTILDELYGHYCTVYNTKSFETVPASWYFVIKQLLKSKKFYQRRWLDREHIMKLVLHAF